MHGRTNRPVLTTSQADGFAVEDSGTNVPMAFSAVVRYPTAAPIDGKAVGLGQTGLTVLLNNPVNPD
jgi:hypothetical protein